MYQNHLFRITSIPFTIYFIVLLGCGTESRSLDKNFFEDGEGTLENPYQIANLDHLQAIGDTVHLDKHFIQIADIDASASTELQNGSGFQPLGTREQPFTGSYNGDGHTISSLFIHNQKTGDDAVGFFGYVKDGLIENITIDNRSPSWLNKVQKSAIENETIMIVDEPPINQVDLSETRGVGGFIGFNDSGIVRNCSYQGVAGGYISQGMAGFIGVNTGTVENAHFDGNLTSGSVAGFVWINAGEIRQSSANGSGDGITGWGFVSTNYGQIINSYVNMDVNGTNGAAGFAGTHEDGIIHSSFASGVTSSSIKISGFVLTNNAEVSNVYSTMNLEVVDFDAPRQISGIVVSNEENGVIENSYFAGSVQITGSSDFSKAAIIENLGLLENLYWDMEQSDLKDAVVNGSPEGATGLSTAQMTGPAAEQNMPEFDWVNVWRTTEDGYPVLRWEEE